MKRIRLLGGFLMVATLLTGFLAVFTNMPINHGLVVILVFFFLVGTLFTVLRY